MKPRTIEVPLMTDSQAPRGTLHMPVKWGYPFKRNAAKMTEKQAAKLRKQIEKMENPGKRGRPLGKKLVEVDIVAEANALRKRRYTWRKISDELYAKHGIWRSDDTWRKLVANYFPPERTK